jgi:hypothetical protein
MNREPRRYVLVPQSDAPQDGRPPIRRFRLGRVAPSPRSALGVDRHERLEQIAERSQPSSS